MKKLVPILSVLLFGALLLLRPDSAAGAVREGLTLCFRTVIPSLFPFFVVVSLLLRLGFAGMLQGLCAPFMGPMFRLRGLCAMPLIAGLLGGYPSGAKTAADLYQQGLLSRQEAELLLGFCNNCGPAFVLGYVGSGVLGSAQAGVWLFLIHMASALLTGILLCRIQRDRGPAMLPCRLPEESVSLPSALTGAISGSFASTLNICAFVVLFRVLAALLPAALPAWALGILEMVSGAAALAPDRLGFVTAAGIVGWGGLSVHCQTMSVAGDLSLRWHWAGKLVQTALSVLLALAAAGRIY